MQLIHLRCFFGSIQLHLNSKFWQQLINNQTPRRYVLKQENTKKVKSRVGVQPGENLLLIIIRRAKRYALFLFLQKIFNSIHFIENIL